MRPDQRSPEAAKYRKLYNTARWRALRKAQLQIQPLCERCKAKGFIVAATVVNHRKPHKGDERLFCDPGNLQSVCQPCHDGPIQAEEVSGKQNESIGCSPQVDRDGWPIDPRHPANRIK
jgi:5-methylcytosine-specific restriction protein A